MRKLSIAILLSASLVTGSFAGRPAAADNYRVKEQIKIGVITDLSGVGAYWGTHAVKGAKLAEQQLNQEGINAEIIIGDHAFSTKTAVSEVQKMLGVDQADAFYVEFAPACVAVSPILKNSRKLFVDGSAAVSPLESNPYAFKAYLDYQKGCREIGIRWRDKGIKKVGMLKLNSEFAELCYKGAKSVFPDIMLHSYNFSDDVSSQVLNFKNKSIEAIFNTGLEGDMVNMLQAMSRINYAVPLAVAEPDSLNERILTKRADIPEGTMAFGLPEISSDFRKALQDFAGPSGEIVAEPAAFAYAHIIQLGEALAACGRTNIDCQVAHMAASKKKSILNFVGWRNRIASYDFTLKEWKGHKLIQVGTFN